MTTPEDAKPKRRLKRWQIILIASILIYMVGNAVSKDASFNTSSSTTTATSSAPQVDTSWIPTDFSSWTDDPNVAWRWLSSKEYDCTGDSCLGMMVIAKNGCKSNLYAEISLVDKSDVQVGYSNDSVSSASPMQKSKLVFNSYEKSATTGRVTKISCY